LLGVYYGHVYSIQPVRPAQLVHGSYTARCQYSVGANFVLFVTNCQQNSSKMKGYPDDIWTLRMWTVKFPGDIWSVEIWTVKTGLGLPLGLGFLLGLDLVLGFELVFRLGLGLVMPVQFMTVQILTVQIKTGNHGTVSSPHFLAHVCCRHTARWIKMPFGMEVISAQTTLC